MDITALQDAVLGKQQVLNGIFSNHGHLSLKDYAASWQVSRRSEKEQNAIIGHVGRILSLQYGRAVADEAEQQLLNKPLVSTIDHLGIFGHPFFLNSNLIYSLHGSEKFLICLATAGVSLNNSSWPGCLLLNGPEGGMSRLSLFRDAQKTQTVLAARGFTAPAVDSVLNRITTTLGSKEHSDRLRALAKYVLLDNDVLGQPDFFRQACLAAPKLWEAAFPKSPKLLYVSLEELVSQVLCEEVVPHPDHVLHKLIFTESGWSSVEKYFHGSLGAFLNDHKGSFLFWGLGDNGRRIHLLRSGNRLENEDFSVSLDPENIGICLASRKLYPTSLVCFFVLLYYNLTCLGGFNQVNWLTGIRQRLSALLEEWGQADLAARIASVPTDNFAESSLAFGLDSKLRVYKPSALDVYLQNDASIYEKYVKLSEQMTVAESIVCQLPEIYQVITPGPDRDGELSAITEADIIERSGLGRKIKDILD